MEQNKFEGFAFSNNIEVIRDIATAIDLKYISNVDGDMRWAAEDHLVIEIAHYASKTYKFIYLEFCGDGIVRVHGLNREGFGLETKVFDTHWFTGIESIRDGFRKFTILFNLLCNYVR